MSTHRDVEILTAVNFMVKHQLRPAFIEHRRLFTPRRSFLPDCERHPRAETCGGVSVERDRCEEHEFVYEETSRSPGAFLVPRPFPEGGRMTERPDHACTGLVMTRLLRRIVGRKQQPGRTKLAATPRRAALVSDCSQISRSVTCWNHGSHYT